MDKDRENEYYIVGARAVKFVRSDTGMDVLVFDKHTGEFKRDISFLSKAIYGYESEEVTKEEFDDYVEDLKNGLI